MSPNKEQNLLAKLRALSPEHVTEVENFIDFSPLNVAIMPRGTAFYQSPLH